MVNVRLTTIAGAQPVAIQLRLPTTIGRSEAAKIKVRNARVSRRHCEVYADDQYAWIRDLGSSNGTYVNEERLTEPRRLGAGDHVRVADVVFRVEVQVPRLAEIEFDPGDVSGWQAAEPAAAGPSAQPSPAAPASSAVLRYRETKEGSFIGIETGAPQVPQVDSCPRIATGGPHGAATPHDVQIETGGQGAASPVTAEDSALHRFLQDFE